MKGWMAVLEVAFHLFPIPCWMPWRVFHFAFSVRVFPSFHAWYSLLLWQLCVREISCMRCDFHLFGVLAAKNWIRSLSLFLLWMWLVLPLSAYSKTHYIFRFISHTFSFRLPLVFSLAAYFASDGVISAYFLLTCYLFYMFFNALHVSLSLSQVSFQLSFPIPLYSFPFRFLGSISLHTAYTCHTPCRLCLQCLVLSCSLVFFVFDSWDFFDSPPFERWEHPRAFWSFFDTFSRWLCFCFCWKVVPGSLLVSPVVFSLTLTFWHSSFSFLTLFSHFFLFSILQPFRSWFVSMVFDVALFCLTFHVLSFLTRWSRCIWQQSSYKL